MTSSVARESFPIPPFTAVLDLWESASRRFESRATLPKSHVRLSVRLMRRIDEKQPDSSYS